MKKKLITCALSALLVMTQQPLVAMQQKKSSFDTATLIKAGLVVAGAVGVTGFIAWLLSRNDQQVVQDAEILCARIKKDYQWIYECSLCNGESLYNGESFLEEFANSTQHAGYFITRFSADLDLVQSELTECRKRLAKLQNDPQSAELMARAQQVIVELEIEYLKLIPLCSSLRKHRLFFKIKSVSLLTKQKYSDVFVIAQKIRSNPHVLDSLLDIIARNSGGLIPRYPFHWYIQQLQNDIHALQSLLTRSPFTYKTLMPESKAMLQELLFLRGEIIKSGRYAQEDYEQQRDLLDEKIKILDERITTAQAKYAMIQNEYSQTMREARIAECQEIQYKLDDIVRKTKQLIDERIQLNRQRSKLDEARSQKTYFPY